MKKILNKTLKHNVFNFSNSFKFSTTSSIKNQKSLIEDEIRNSFSSFTSKFNIDKNSLPKNNKNYNYDLISMKQIEDKYYNNASTKDIDIMIKNLYKEEVLNMNQAKEFDDLVLFITNCKKYNYPDYLTDVKFYRNKQIRNLMTNTNLLESLANKKSPYSLENDFQAKFKVQNLYKLRKGKKGEKLDSVTMKEFEVERYKYLNYLCETSTYTKMGNLNQFSENNQRITEEFYKAEDLNEKPDAFDETKVRDHYIQYLKKLKKEERNQSEGISRFEEEGYNRMLNEHKDEIYDQAKTGTGKKMSSDSEQKVGMNEYDETTYQSNGTRYTSTQATDIKDGSDAPYPYYGMDDYEFEAVMDSTQFQPGSIHIY